MKSLTTSLLFSVSILANLPSLADTSSCLPSLPKDQLAASYQIDESTAKINRSNRWSYWRNGDQIAVTNPKRHSVEIWQRQGNQQLNYSRLFTQAKKRIDYTEGDLLSLGRKVSWQQVSEVFPIALLQQLKPVASSLYRCHKVVRYQGKINQKDVLVDWLPHLSLPAKMETHQGKYKTILTLQSLTDGNKLQAQLETWSQFAAVDYADIGDNESDPFISKLINQGFIEHHEAVYRADGVEWHQH